MKKNLINDFVIDKTIDIEINGRIFKYKPTTAGDENAWLNKYMKVDKNGKPYQDFSELNKLKLLNIVDAPYQAETIKKVIGVNKDFKELTNEEKWSLLKKLKGGNNGVFEKLLKSIQDYDDGDDVVKKQ